MVPLDVLPRLLVSGRVDAHMQRIPPRWAVYHYETFTSQPPYCGHSPFCARRKMLGYEYGRSSSVDLPENHRHLGLADPSPQAVTEASTYR